MDRENPGHLLRPLIFTGCGALSIALGAMVSVLLKNTVLNEIQNEGIDLGLLIVHSGLFGVLLTREKVIAHIQSIISQTIND